MDRFHYYFGWVSAAAIALCVALGYMAYSDPRLHGFHFLAGFLTTMLVILWLSLMMFHFIYTGSTIKTAAIQKTVAKEDYYKTRGYKKALFPWVLIAMILISATPLLGAAADVGMAPVWYHHVVAWEALILAALVIYLSKDKLTENRRIYIQAVETTFVDDPEAARDES